MKSSTLPLTSPCSGTKRKTTVPLFFASTGGLRLLSFIPILLLSLQFIDFYSSSLAGLQVRRARIVPLTDLYSISRFNLLISTVLPFAGLQVPTGSDCPSYRPILHQSLDSVDCLVLLTPLCQITTYIYQ